jgi:transposase InsO family protein
MVNDVCKKCHICQKTKKSTKKYGHLPEKTAEAEPWTKLCVDLIGPYYIKKKGQKTAKHKLWCVTMIDPATGWFKMSELPDKRADTVANIVEQAWLTRYPWPDEIIYDKGSEFMAEFAKMIQEEYDLEKRKTTTRNPQANAVLERVHQTLGNIIRTYQVHDIYLDEEHPWDGILAATMFAIRATYHTTLQATPAQLVFGRDAILNMTFEANWNFIHK